VTSVRVLETLIRFTPLGVRFWDATSDAPILERLDVRAWRADGNYGPVTATRGATGIYSFHDLPGMRDLEFPRAGISAPGPTQFVVSVVDTHREFLSVAFGVTLPLAGHGLFPAAFTNPPRVGERLFLFPSPARTLVPGFAAVRADLWDSEANAPARWAVLDVLAAGAHHLGVADERGSVLVAFPAPQVESLSQGSPPGSGQIPLSQVTWPVSARVRYQPSLVRFPLVNRAPVPWRDIPSLRSVLEEQGVGTVEPNEGAPAPEIDAQMRFGESLVLRTVFPSPRQFVPLLVRRSP
jgi:hypothetical protein